MTRYYCASCGVAEGFSDRYEHIGLHETCQLCPHRLENHPPTCRGAFYEGPTRSRLTYAERTASWTRSVAVRAQ